MQNPSLDTESAQSILRSLSDDDIFNWALKRDALARALARVVEDLGSGLSVAGVRAWRQHPSLLSPSQLQSSPLSRAPSSRGRASGRPSTSSKSTTPRTSTTRTADSARPATGTAPSAHGKADNALYSKQRSGQRGKKASSVQSTPDDVDIISLPSDRRGKRSYADTLKFGPPNSSPPTPSTPLESSRNQKQKRNVVYLCPKPGCQQEICYPSTLRDHFGNIHDPLVERTCKHCGDKHKYRTVRLFNEHHRTHKEKDNKMPKIRCNFILQGSASESMDCAEVKAVQRRNAYGCSLCTRPFSDQSTFLTHYCKDHQYPSEKDKPSPSKEILGLLCQPDLADIWRNWSKSDHAYSWDDKVAPKLREQLETGEIDGLTLRKHGHLAARKLVSRALELSTANVLPRTDVATAPATKDNIATSQRDERTPDEKLGATYDLTGSHRPPPDARVTLVSQVILDPSLPPPPDHATQNSQYPGPQAGGPRSRHASERSRSTETEQICGLSNVQFGASEEDMPENLDISLLMP